MIDNIEKEPVGDKCATCSDTDSVAHFGYFDSKEKLLKRLKRAEGQLRGIQRMVENDKYCVDILTQISSVQAAIQQTAVLIIEDHLRHCVRQAIEKGGEESDKKIEEMVGLLRWATRQPPLASDSE